MKQLITEILAVVVISFLQLSGSMAQKPVSTDKDSLILLQMVREREEAMQKKDIKRVAAQFREDATFINGGGYYVQSRQEIEEFHNLIAQGKPGYTSTYQAGKVTIQILTPDFALAYYPWQIITLKTTHPLDTLKGTGLMTLLAQKDARGWKWRAVTNQQTKEYFDDLKTHTWKQRQ